MARRSSGRFRGGSIGRRDRRFGIHDDAFWRWWHRVGKDDNDYRDLATVAEAQRVYRDWIAAGRPKVK
jgi:hypothetical protein